MLRHQTRKKGPGPVSRSGARRRRSRRRQQVPGAGCLVPAFVTSELKTAFIMGFCIYIPFLLVDLVVSVVLMSLGMMMMPPVVVSTPLKILLFVLVDGWRLIMQGDWR